MDEKIIERVRKLLELAHGNTSVSEAANAASAAQTLMSRHAISEAMLGKSSTEPEEQIEQDLLHSGKQNTTWRGGLAMAICAANGCGVYRQSGDLVTFGRPSDAAKVRYLFAYVSREIERLCEQESALRGSPGKTWHNSFKNGAVAEISRRISEAASAARAAMRREADASDTLGTGAAIVLVDSALAKLDKRTLAVASYGKLKLKLRKGSSSHSRTDFGAREAGKRAAATINLDNAAGALGAGNSKALRA